MQILLQILWFLDVGDLGQVPNRVNPCEENCVKRLDDEINIMNTEYPLLNKQQYCRCVITLTKTIKIRLNDVGFVNVGDRQSTCPLSFSILPRGDKVCVEEGARYFEEMKLDEFTVGENAMWHITLEILSNDYVVRGMWFWIQLTGM